MADSMQKAMIAKDAARRKGEASNSQVISGPTSISPTMAPTPISSPVTNNEPTITPNPQVIPLSDKDERERQKSIDRAIYIQDRRFNSANPEPIIAQNPQVIKEETRPPQDSTPISLEPTIAPNPQIEQQADWAYSPPPPINTEPVLSPNQYEAPPASSYSTPQMTDAQLKTFTKSKPTPKSTPRPKTAITTRAKSQKESKKGKPIPYIIGAVPGPSLEATRNVFHNSQLIVEIIPCIPVMSDGLSLFTIQSKLDEFKSRLKIFGYEIGPGDCIKIAIQADITPSESFSNDYGESFLSKITDVASSGAAELNQITGSTNAAQAAGKLANVGGKVMSGIPYAKEAMEGIATKAQELEAWSKSAPGGAKGAANMALAMLGGARIDFPQVWKNSAFSTSYSVTVKLYNPSPGNAKATDFFIIGPLATLLLLGLPKEQEELKGRAYNYPYFHKIKCKGLFEIDQGAITSIQVTKGTEGQIAFNQNLGMVEVKMDFIDLHAHMVGSSDTGTNIPTLGKYLKILKESRKPLESMYVKSDNEEESNKQESNTDDYSGAPNQQEYDHYEPGPQPDSTTSPTERIDPDQDEMAKDLIANNPKELAPVPVSNTDDYTGAPIQENPQYEAPPIVEQMPPAVQAAAAKGSAEAQDAYKIEVEIKQRQRDAAWKAMKARLVAAASG
jgi:hypothetical protein